MNKEQLLQKISDYAYEQEKIRRQNLEMKTEYLFKWITFALSIVGVAVPIISKQIQLNVFSTWFVILYCAIVFFLFAAVAVIIIITFPKKMKLHRTASDILKKEQSDGEQTIEEMIHMMILENDVVTKDMRKKNSMIAIGIMIADICIGLGLLCSIIFFGYIIWGM